MDLIFTGRHVDAEEALFLGLVNRVAEDALEEAKKLAQKILKNAPIALALAKESVVRGEGLDLAEALEIEADPGHAAATEDMKEGCGPSWRNAPRASRASRAEALSSRMG